jgi:hypothetical protein
LKKTIDREVRPHVLVLNPRISVARRSHDDRHARRLQVKDRVDEIAARVNRLDVAAAENGRLQELEVAQQQVRVHPLADVKRVLTLDARSRQQREGAGKPVLVDGGRSGGPEQRLDIEPRLPVDDERGLAEFHREVVLSGQHGRLGDPVDDLIVGDPFVQPRAAQGLARNRRQTAAIEINRVPFLAHAAAQRLEDGRGTAARRAFASRVRYPSMLFGTPPLTAAEARVLGPRSFSVSRFTVSFRGCRLAALPLRG